MKHHKSCESRQKIVPAWLRILLNMTKCSKHKLSEDDMTEFSSVEILTGDKYFTICITSSTNLVDAYAVTL